MPQLYNPLLDQARQNQGTPQDTWFDKFARWGAGDQMGGMGANPIQTGAAPAALWLPRLYRAMQDIPLTGVAAHDFEGPRNLAQALLKQAPALKQGGQVFNPAESELSILNHTVTPAGVPQVPGETAVARHSMEFGLRPPGAKNPLPLGEMDLRTYPQQGTGMVDFAGSNPAIRMSMQEYRGLQDRIGEFLRQFGAKNLAAEPASAARERLFGMTQNPNITNPFKTP